MINGFLLGVVSTFVFLIIILPFISKLIMKRAIKKQSSLLLGDIQNKMGKFQKMLNPQPKETLEE